MDLPDPFGNLAGGFLEIGGNEGVSAGERAPHQTPEDTQACLPGLQRLFRLRPIRGKPTFQQPVDRAPVPVLAVEEHGTPVRHERERTFTQTAGKRLRSDHAPAPTLMKICLA